MDVLLGVNGGEAVTKLHLPSEREWFHILTASLPQEFKSRTADWNAKLCSETIFGWRLVWYSVFLSAVLFVDRSAPAIKDFRRLHLMACRPVKHYSPNSTTTLGHGCSRRFACLSHIKTLRPQEAGVFTNREGRGGETSIWGDEKTESGVMEGGMMSSGVSMRKGGGWRVKTYKRKARLRNTYMRFRVLCDAACGVAGTRGGQRQKVKLNNVYKKWQLPEKSIPSLAEACRIHSN